MTDSNCDVDDWVPRVVGSAGRRRPSPKSQTFQTPDRNSNTSVWSENLENLENRHRWQFQTDADGLASRRGADRSPIPPTPQPVWQDPKNTIINDLATSTNARAHIIRPVCGGGANTSCRVRNYPAPPPLQQQQPQVALNSPPPSKKALLFSSPFSRRGGGGGAGNTNKRVAINDENRDVRVCNGKDRTAGFKLDAREGFLEQKTTTEDLRARAQAAGSFSSCASGGSNPKGILEAGSMFLQERNPHSSSSLIHHQHLQSNDCLLKRAASKQQVNNGGQVMNRTANSGGVEGNNNNNDINNCSKWHPLNSENVVGSKKHGFSGKRPLRAALSEWTQAASRQISDNNVSPPPIHRDCGGQQPHTASRVYHTPQSHFPHLMTLTAKTRSDDFASLLHYSRWNKWEWVVISGFPASRWGHLRVFLEPIAGPIEDWVLTEGNVHFIRFRTAAMAQKCLLISGCCVGGLVIHSDTISSSLSSSSWLSSSSSSLLSSYAKLTLVESTVRKKGTKENGSEQQHQQQQQRLSGLFSFIDFTEDDESEIVVHDENSLSSSCLSSSSRMFAEPIVFRPNILSLPNFIGFGDDRHSSKLRKLMSYFWNCQWANWLYPFISS